MASLDVAGSQSAGKPAAQGAGLEKLGLWLMAAYWLAMLGMFALGGMAAG
jgi:hypothetical protein